MPGLFSEFKPTTAEEWKTQLIKELKGDAFESLVWKNENGFDIQPFYTSADLKNTAEPAFTHSDWEICVSAKSINPEEQNAQLLKQLNSGASSISVSLINSDPETVLKGIQLNYIKSTFIVDAQSVLALESYLKKNYDPDVLNMSLFPANLASAADLEKWIQSTAIFVNFKNIKTWGIDALNFHNLNCDAYYEVAVILSGLIELLNTLHEKNLASRSAFVIKTGVSADYFMQIAKLRTLRRLWHILKAEYKIENELYVIVETGQTNKSISDSYNNLLRTTVESMAAVSGGCNELIVTEFDSFFAVNNNLSQRMAVNQQLILKDESYLDKMADIACGSYYIETITDRLAEKALEKMKHFENEGGYFRCLEKNIFKNDIAVQAKEKEQLISDKTNTVIGVNKFRNEKENIQLPAEKRAQLKNLTINNPVLKFELENYFKQNA